MEDPEPAACGKHTLGDDSPDASDLESQPRLGQRGYGRCVYIAVRKVPQEIARGADAQSFQRLSAPLSDSLEELDGCL